MKVGWPVLNDLGDWVCEHGTAVDVHCCHCHSGFIFDDEHVCPDLEDAMDTRTGHIYDSIEEAKAAGVPDEFLVSGSKEALDNLKKQLKFRKGPFKTIQNAEAETK